MKTSPAVLLIACVAMIFVQGCDHVTAPQASEDNPLLVSEDDATIVFSRNGSDTSSDRSDALTYDEQSALLAEIVPGFAGVYMDRQGRFVVMSVSNADGGPPDETAVLSALRQIPIESKHTLINRIQELLDEKPSRVRQASFTYRELFDWKLKLRASGASQSAMSSYGIDNETNRIEVGVPNLADTTALRAHFVSLGIPMGAVAFHRRGVAKHFSNPLNIYSSYIKPAPGGVAVDPNVAFGPCTLGFNVDAYYGGAWHRAFITAGHCADGYATGTTLNYPTYTGQIGDQFFQPVYSWGRYLGSARFYSMPVVWAPYAHSGDAALIEYTGTEPYWRGAIAKPYDWLYWDGTSVYKVRKILFGGSLIQGTAARKVGIGTGETHGIIDETCVDLPAGDGPAKWCQISVTLPDGVSESIAEPGDSGAPVFQISSGTDVIGIGVLWGGAWEPYSWVHTFYATSINGLHGEGMEATGYRFGYVDP